MHFGADGFLTEKSDSQLTGNYHFHLVLTQAVKVVLYCLLFFLYVKTFLQKGLKLEIPYLFSFRQRTTLYLHLIVSLITHQAINSFKAQNIYLWVVMFFFQKSQAYRLHYSHAKKHINLQVCQNLFISVKAKNHSSSSYFHFHVVNQL